MDYDKLNRWLLLIANFGVLIGFFLLIVEIDQNSDLLRAQIRQARSDEHVVARMGVADSNNFLAAMLKFEQAGGFGNFASIEQLSSLEARRIREFLVARHQDYDSLQFQFQQGYLDQEYYDHRIAPSIRFFAPWWERLGISEGTARRPSFQKEIDRLLFEEAE